MAILKMSRGIFGLLCLVVNLLIVECFFLGRVSTDCRREGSILCMERNLSSEEVRERNRIQTQRLRERDRKARSILVKDLVVVYEDEYLVVVEKPPGTLSVPSEPGLPALAKTVFRAVDHGLASYDRMVVHRLGMETSGLMIFAKTMDALRGMNSLFRIRKVEKLYEVLVCGHVPDDSGTIDLPLMRDYECPPFMRISSPQLQQKLMQLDPSIVGKKLLEPPKTSKTIYRVLSREVVGEEKLPVTRMTLESVTGRTHQLNVHMAALGHPIVNDLIYGCGGNATQFGGLDKEQRLSADAVDETLAVQIRNVIPYRSMCAHASVLRFQHPVTGEACSFQSKAPF